MELYSPCIPLTLSFLPFVLNNLAGEKGKPIILKKEVMSNSIVFNKRDKRDERDMTSRFTSKPPTFSSRNFEEVRGDEHRTTWNKPSCAFDVIESGSCGNDGISDEHSGLVATSIVPYSSRFASMLDSMKTTTSLKALIICMAIICCT